MKKLIFAAAAACVLTLHPALAHHSTTNYDSSRTIALEGTVTKFQWTNPHSWIDLKVPDGKGNEVAWAVEFGSPNLNVRAGWKHNDIKPGDKITAVVYPLRSGALHGQLVTVTLPDGRVLKGAATFIREEELAPPGAKPPGASAQ